MNIRTFVILVSLMASAAATFAADVTGTITLIGPPPPEIPLTPLMQNPSFASMYSNTPTPTTHFYEVGPNGGLGDVVVYLEDASGKPITGKSTGASAPPVVLNQKGGLFTPQIMAIQTGQTLLVTNSDPVFHDVHTEPTNNPAVDEVQVPGTNVLSFNFANPEMYLTFNCDVHPWMFAWVSIFDNPYFNVSSKDGKFTITNVPPGQYTLVAEHRKLGVQIAKIDVTTNGVVHNFAFTMKGYLSIALAQHNTILGWSTNSLGYQLEKSGSVADGQWSPVTTPLTTNASQISVMLPLAATNTFFRLYP